MSHRSTTKRCWMSHRSTTFRNTVHLSRYTLEEVRHTLICDVLLDTMCLALRRLWLQLIVPRIQTLCWNDWFFLNNTVFTFTVFIYLFLWPVEEVRMLLLLTMMILILLRIITIIAIVKLIYWLLLYHVSCYKTFHRRFKCNVLKIFFIAQ